MQLGLLFKNLGVNVRSGVNRFPEAVFLAVAWGSVAIWLNHLGAMHIFDGSIMPVLQRFLYVFALGCPVFLCVRVFFERMPDLEQKVKILIYVLAVLGLLAHYGMVPQMDRMASFRYMAYNIFFYLAFTFIPYFYRRENYEHYMVSLACRFVVTGLCAFILYAGLSTILYTMQVLFAMHVREVMFLDLACITVIFAVVFFLAGVPEPHHRLDPENYPRVLKLLLLYIVLPLLVAYSAVLYIYFFKILISRQWPDNVVGQLVLWYAIISALVLFFVYPLRAANEWLDKFSVYFPKIMLPLLIMMFISVFKRINAYGVTEGRYVVLLAGAVVAGYMLYTGFRKQPRNIVFTVAIAVLAVLSVWGPWNCFAVSKLSQNMRFERILQKYDMINNDLLTKSAQPLSDEDKAEIMSIIRYFDIYYNLADLKHIPPGYTPPQIAGEFGLTTSAAHYFAHSLKDEGIFVNVKDFDYFAEIRMYGDNKGSDTDAAYKYYLENQKELNIISRGEVVYRSNIEDIALQVHNQHQGTDKLTQQEMTFIDENAKVRVLYIFKVISGTQEETTGNSRIVHRECYIFVKAK